MSQSRTAKRYHAFAFKKHRKIEAFVHVVTCKSCASPMLNQKACPACGTYRGRNVRDLKKTVEKVTKIKA